ncbi:MAG: hypothetical protein C4525_15330 [Desulfarculus sp.]|jgi:hypothetical protein|nr:MAG: hypothetical protein C4525_15330 [Desulfarculus sp.]
MSERYRRCPQCGATKFWIDDELGHKVVFRVTSQGAPEAAKEPGRDLSLLDFSLIHCLSCGWSGSLGELKA